MKKNIIVLLILIALIISTIIIFGIFKSNFTGSDIRKACTMEAKICLDGSSVGRSGPHCEFAPCPVAPALSLEPTAASQIANPASVNCGKTGGTLTIKKRTDGGEYGLCYFEDNRVCEEWSLLRGDCPIGGVKITGYDNDAEVYCAATGGKVEGVGTPTPMCKRIDGTYCNAQANLDGQCPNPYDPSPNAGNREAP